MVRILLQKSTENKAEKMAQITEKVDVCVIGAQLPCFKKIALLFAKVATEGS